MAPSPAGRAAALAVAVALSAPLVPATGCSSSDGGSRPASTSPTAGATTPGTAGPDARSAAVSLVDYDFEPRELDIDAGDSVIWINNDEVDHWVVSLDPDVLDSGRMSKAATYEHQFTQPGEYRYYCSLHNYMKGTIVVR